MKQSKLEKHLNSKAHIILLDDSEYEGILRLAEHETYFVESGDQCRFSASLVKELKKV